MNHYFAPFSFLALPLWLARLLSVAASVPVLALFVFAASDTTVIQLISENRAVATAVAFYIFSAAASAMRTPQDGFYNWLFRFVNILAANSRELIHKPATTELPK